MWQLLVEDHSGLGWDSIQKTISSVSGCDDDQLNHMTLVQIRYFKTMTQKHICQNSYRNATWYPAHLPSSKIHSTAYKSAKMINWNNILNKRHFFCCLHHRKQPTRLSGSCPWLCLAVRFRGSPCRAALKNRGTSQKKQKTCLETECLDISHSKSCSEDWSL